MPGPLLAVDAPSLLYRAFYALPKTITDDEGTPVNALLGVSNLVLQAVEHHAPRAVVLCFGEEAAHYRVELYPDLPRRPHRHARGARAASGATRPRSSAPSTGSSCATRRSRPTTCSAASPRPRREAGGQALLFTGDRDMFQCVSDDVTVLWPAGKGETEPIGPAEVRKRYGVRPDQVPDFIALRGDPSDGLPGAKGIGEKTARELLNEHDTLEALLALPMSLRPRVRQSLTDQARRAARLPARSPRCSRRAWSARPTRRPTSPAPPRRPASAR